ncbi:MAG: hypothetical protein Q9157_000231 [Trypethelium eluteriae]
MLGRFSDECRLVATLGSRSSLRKVNRKDIQAVNVKKACETIVMPEAPMALRLQSNLLYGVSRVYSQQCTYVLADAQSAQQNIRTLLRVVQTAQLDPQARKARPEQLTLSDDPAFLPDMTITSRDLDAALFEFSTSTAPLRSSSILSPTTLMTEPSKSSLSSFVGGLDIPSSSFGGPVETSGINLQGDDGPELIAPRPSDVLQREAEEEGFLPEPEFTIDAEGNLIEFAAAEQTRPSDARSRGLPSTPVPRLPSDAAPSAHARPIHMERMDPQVSRASRVWNDPNSRQDDIPLSRATSEDMQLPAVDDYALPSDAKLFSVGVTPSAGRVNRPSSTTFEEYEESSSEVRVPQRRRRRQKPLPPDAVLELRNADLVRWNTEYPTNMQAAKERKEAAKSARQAKQNAELWVIERGLGNVGWGFGRDRLVRNPILAELFSGAGLWEGATGIKRRHETEDTEPDEGEDLDANSRRVRARYDEDEDLGRGEPMEIEEVLRLGGDEDIELAREAPSALDAHLSDTMPWNVTASLRHSSAARSAGPGPFTAAVGLSSAGGPSSVGARPGSLGRPRSRSRSRAGSRIVSASPLVGRGLGLPLDPSLAAVVSQEEPAQPVGEDQPRFLTSTDAGAGGEEAELQTMSGVHPEFELYGLGAAVDTQTAATSQWVQAALDAESANFLEFVKVAVAGHIQDREQYEEEPIRAGDVRITFEELLPPERNTRLVAASGLLHVLSLASTTLVRVDQEEDFGEIGLRIVDEL